MEFPTQDDENEADFFMAFSKLELLILGPNNDETILGVDVDDAMQDEEDPEEQAVPRSNLLPVIEGFLSGAAPHLKFPVPLCCSHCWSILFAMLPLDP